MVRVDLKRILIETNPEDEGSSGWLDWIMGEIRFFCEGIVFSVLDGGTIVMVVRDLYPRTRG